MSDGSEILSLEILTLQRQRSHNIFALATVCPVAIVVIESSRRRSWWHRERHGETAIENDSVGSSAHRRGAAAPSMHLGFASLDL